MVRINLTEENLISTTGIADRRFADHSGDIQHGYELGSLTRGLVAYYPMEKGQGQVLFDGATGNHGQIEGATWNGSGKVGNDSLAFNGTSDYVSRDILPNRGTRPFSVSVWVNTNSTSEQVIVTNAEDADSEGWAIGIKNGNFSSRVENSGAAGISGAAVSTDTWTHLCLTYDPSDSSQRFYVDGVEGSGSDSTRITKIAANFVIGARNDTTEFNFDGEIDDVRVYSRPLSQPEIEALAGLTEPSGFLVEEQDVPTLREFERDLGGAVSRYEFENDVTDSWGENDGTDNTSAGFVDGVFGQAKDFDGSDDFVTVAHDSSLSPESGTLSAWVHPDTSLSVDGYIIDKNVNDGVGYGFLQQEDDTIEFIAADDTGIRKVSGVDLPIGSWSHLTVSWESNDSLEAYLNGSIVGSLSFGNYSPGTFDLRVGRIQDSDSSYYNGAVDDVRVYSDALDPIEVEQLFNKGAYRIKRGNL